MATEAGSDIKIFKFTVGVSQMLEDVKKLIVPVLRPAWSPDDVKETELTGGTVNSMRAYHVTQQPQSEDAFVVRIFGSATLSFLGDRDNEFVAMQLAHAAGCFPSVLGSFENGIITGSAPGGRMGGWELLDDEVIREITRKIADYHWIVKMDVPVVNRLGQPTTIPVVHLFEKLTSCLRDFDKLTLDPDMAEKIREATTPVEVLLREVDFLAAHLNPLELPRAFCHYDLHPGNMMRDPDTGIISIVDYEFAGVNIAAYDFAYLFLLIKFFLAGSVTPGATGDDPLTPERKEYWTRCYLERMFEIHGHHASDVTTDDLQAWMLSFKVMALALNLTNGIMSLVFIPSDSPIPYIQIHPGCMQAWFAKKDSLPELCEQYREAKNKCTRL